MSVVLAAIDNSAAARPVLDFARELAAFLGAEVEVEVVHVEETGATRTAAENARALRFAYHRRRGEVVRTIAATAKERDALVVVIGSRGTPGGATPAGHITMELIRTLDLPVAVVPPQAELRPIRRVLVATEGDGESHALRHLMRYLRRPRELEVIALHVITDDRLPMFGDQPVHETEAWAEEFRRRVLQAGDRSVKLEVRVGDAAQTLPRVVREEKADLVVLAWHQRLEHGHGRLVRSALAESEVPVLLYPIG